MNISMYEHILASALFAANGFIWRPHECGQENERFCSGWFLSEQECGEAKSCWRVVVPAETRTRFRRNG
jgi:hypothetical protein